jgi:DNA-binding Lrp family transcriptional regulator
MPRALTRDEQAILARLRRTAASQPIPELATELGISAEQAQAACEYLVDRGLLRATIYAVSVPKPATAAAPAEATPAA